MWPVAEGRDYVTYMRVYAEMWHWESVIPWELMWRMPVGAGVAGPTARRRRADAGADRDSRRVRRHDRRLAPRRPALRASRSAAAPGRAARLSGVRRPLPPLFQRRRHGSRLRLLRTRARRGRTSGRRRDASPCSARRSSRWRSRDPPTRCSCCSSSSRCSRASPLGTARASGRARAPRWLSCRSPRGLGSTACATTTWRCPGAAVPGCPSTAPTSPTT